jgi:hypothetical protein
MTNSQVGQIDFTRLSATTTDVPPVELKGKLKATVEGVIARSAGQHKYASTESAIGTSQLWSSTKVRYLYS